MNVHAEEEGKVARRQAIQAIMKDSSLTAQEKQSKIQRLMAGAGSSAEGAARPSPSEPGPPAPAGTNVAAAPQASNSRQAMMQQVMKDPTLTSQEKQKRIQEILKSGQAPPDSSSNGPAAAAAAAPAPSQRSASVTSATTTGAVAGSAAQAGHLVGATSVTGEDPAAKKGSRTATKMAHTAGVSQAGLDTRVAASTAATMPSLGAVASTGTDPGARKSAARGSMKTVGAATMEQARGGDTSMPEPLAASSSTAATSAGAVAGSVGADPASRKGGSGRGSTNTSAAAAAAGGGGLAAAAPGAVTSSRAQDPAARKSQRSSARSAGQSGPPAAAAAVAVGASQSSAAEDAAGRKGPRSSSRSTNAAAATTAAAATAAVGVGVVAAAAASGEPPLAVVPSGTQVYTDVPMDPAMVENRDLLRAVEDVPRSATIRAAPPATSSFTQSPPAGSPETAAYAGLTYSGDIAGADTGGIQAYVAPDEVDEEAIDALGVVTETQLEEEDKLRKRRYLRRGIVIFLLLIVVAVVPAVVVQNNKNGGGTTVVVNVTDSPTEAPSTSPTTSNFAELLSTIEGLYGDNNGLFEESFSDPESPQYQAAVWAANDAPVGLTGADPRMVSRYALATLYFATNGDAWGRCGRDSTNCDVSQEWLTAEDECDWYAIECADPANGNYSVVKVFFPPNGGISNNMVGSLPYDVSFLSTMAWFISTRELISGPFPDWSMLTTLEQVLLNGNKISGTFPEFLITNNPLLGTIHFSSNNLEGQLPAFTPSSALLDFRLDANNFTGPIPPEISNLSSLQTLYLDDNLLTGFVPDLLYSLTDLANLRLSNNTGLSGTISTAIGGLSKLMRLRIENTGMGGPIPEEIYNLTELRSLELGQGSFSGPLSESISQLTNLDLVRLSNNTFTGTIPDGFESLPFLASLELHANDMTGNISAELCARRGEGFDEIKVLTADCAGDPPQVFCDCCTLCA